MPQAIRVKKTEQKPQMVDHFQTVSSNPLTEAEKAKVDEFTTLAIKISAMKAEITRHDKLKAELNAVSQDKARFPDNSAPVVLTGNSYEVEFSPAGQKREISNINGLIGALKAKIGYDGMVSIISVALGEVDKYLSASESGPFIQTVFGSRTLKSFRAKK